MEIFKIQLPLSSTEPKPLALIYNENRDIEEFISTTQVKHYFVGAQKKVFIYGELIDGTLNLYDKAPYQEW